MAPATITADKAVAPFAAEDYQFALDPELQTIAETELRETEEARQHGIQFLRDWLDKNPKIVKCRYDSSFLLRFLRAKKFSLPAVQTNMERVIMMRQCYMNRVFRDICLEKEAGLADLLDRGFIVALPKRDKLGRRVIVTQLRVFDFEKHTLRDIMRLLTLTTDVLNEDEENQIRGYTYIIDATGASLQFLTLVRPAFMVKMVKNGEALLPMRHGLGVGYNVPTGFKLALDLGLSFLSEKLRARIRQVTDLPATCPELPADMLPKELGGTGGPVADMVKLWKEELKSKLDVVKQNNELEANLKMFSEKEMDGVFDESSEEAVGDEWGMDAATGLAGSFRKIQVD